MSDDSDSPARRGGAAPLRSATPRTRRAGAATAGAAQRRADQHQAKADAIVEAAARLIHARGVAGTSLDDLAEALGVTKPSVYYYVRNKEELVFLCHMRIAEQQALAIDAAFAATGDGAHRIKVFIQRYAQFVWAPDSGLPKLWQDSSLGAQRRRDVNRAYYRQSRRLQELIAGAAADGSIVIEDVEIAERCLLSAILWVPSWFHEQQLDFDAPLLLARLMRLVFDGLTPRPQRAAQRVEPDRRAPRRNKAT